MIEWILAHPYQVAGLLLPIVIPLALFQVLPLLVLLERRGASFIQDRVGPNRAAVYIQARSLKGIFSGEAGGFRLRAFGLIFTTTDLVKLLFKENFVPPFAFKSFYWLAPAIPIFTALLTPALIPWFAPIPFSGEHGLDWLPGTLITTNSGLLLLFALGALSVYGVVLGSWSSNSKYSLLGGMRASAMMISYEVSMGLSVLGMLLIVGSFSLTDIVEWQGRHTWGVVVQPIGFLLFLIAMFAETNRNPFDVAEGESELIAGFHTEFAGMRFMLYMTGEYFHVLVASALLATIYFGGYELLPFPGFGTDFVKANLGAVLGVLLAGGGFALIGFAALVNGRRAHYSRLEAQDRELRLKEYRLYTVVFGGAGLGMLAAAVAAALLLQIPAASSGVYPGWVNAVTAVVQFHIVIAKTIAFCLLFIWVRWTLPRFRYDQIMALGWKVLLNVALVNLLVTAIIAKAIG